MQNSSKFPIILMIASLLFVLFHACNTNDPVPENKFPANKVNSIFIDEQGIVWAGTDIGIMGYWNDKWNSYEKLNTGEVFDIHGTKNRMGIGTHMWLATSKGTQLVEYTSDSITSVSLYNKDNSGLPDNHISAIITNPLDAIWFATPIGLSLLNKNKWYSENEFGDMEQHPVISMAAKSDGWIFAGTTGLGVGRFKYDSGIDGITGASYYNTEWTSLPSDTILCIFVDKNNSQWFGTPKGVAFHGVWETKKEWKVYSLSDGLINNRVQAITTDAAGNLWFGTASGVSSFDGQNWKNYSVADGLGDSCINDMVADDNGSIWVATNKGISVFDNFKWKTFSK